MSEVRAVVLDIDGTILLSNEAHARAYVEAAGSLGVPGDFNTVLRLIGKGSEKLIPEAFRLSPESELAKRLDELKGEIFRHQLLPSLQPAPGARDLLRRLRDDGITLVVATSASKEDVGSLLDKANVKDLVEKTASADETDASKPDPDVVQAALEKAGVRPDEAIMLGDTPYDVEASLRAGVPIVAVRCGGWPDTALRGALAIYDHPADVLAHYEQIPFGK